MARALPASRARHLGPVARLLAGPLAEDAVRVAGELAGAGRRVALEHVPGRGEDAVAALTDLVARVADAGPAGVCELTVPVDRLGADGARAVAEAAVAGGVGVCMTGRGGAVDTLLPSLPAVRTAVRAAEPGALRRCRALAGRSVRLVAGRGSAADRTLAGCLNVLLPAGGPLAVAATHPRLLAVVGERATWYDRPSDTWEHVMPYGVRTAEQQRLVAAGAGVRVAVLSGPGAAALLVRRVLGAVA